MKPTIRYRLYTEQKDLRHVKNLINAHFSAYTIIPGNIGVWNGKDELSFIVEIITTPEHEKSIYTIARNILRDNGQESVLVTKEYIESEEVLIF